jgi:hypothetical protein
MGGDAVLRGRPACTWPAGPVAGYPVLARSASGPANQPVAIVAVVELTSCTVPAGVSALPGSAAGTTTAGAR